MGVSAHCRRAYDGLPGPAKAQEARPSRARARSREATGSSRLRHEATEMSTPTESRKYSLILSVRSSAFAWKPNGVSSIALLPLPADARSSRWTFTMVGEVSPDPMMTRRAGTGLVS